MSLGVIAFGAATVEDTVALKTKPEFRKASLKMQLASVAIGNAMSHLGSWTGPSNALGMVLNSGYGEIEATAEFLKTLSETGLARPLLFQNSLHNSTTGFASIQFKISGPVLTVNHRAFGGEQALWTAQALLEDDECKICFVSTLETVPKEFGENAGSQGATCLALANLDWARANGFQVLAVITDVLVDASKVPEAQGSAHVFESLYSYDPVYRIGESLRNSKTLQGSLLIEKAPFGVSRVVFQ